MQTSTVSPVTNITANTTAVTKSKEQILIQSSGAMIAVIVVGIIIILTLLLIIMKTYNRRTHAARVLGTSGGSKPRQPKMSSSTVQSNMPMSNIGVSTVSGSTSLATPSTVAENGFRFPRVELNSINSDSTVVTIHDTPSLENT